MKKSHLVLLISILIILLSFAVVSIKYRSNPVPASTAADEKTLPAADLTAPSPTQPLSKPSDELGESVRLVYGKSGLNRPLVVYRINSGKSTQPRKIMCVFGIHGFEDAWYRDGEELVKIAQGTADYFQAHRADLQGYELLLIPCANPDGVYQGWTCEGPGRCQLSLGIDMNMDFDYQFKIRKNTRNLTGEAPFSAPESVALRDLILQEKPDLVIDFQGWVNSAAGDPAVSQVFCRDLGVQIDPWEKVIYPGFFIGWAAKHSKAVLVEYPNPYTGKGELNGHNDKKLDQQIKVEQWGFTEKTVQALKDIIESRL